MTNDKCKFNVLRIVLGGEISVLVDTIIKIHQHLLDQIA